MVRTDSQRTVRRSVHVPVLLQEVVDFIVPEQCRLVVDGTVGGGGHAAALCARMVPGSTLLCLDRDTDALERAKERLRGVPPQVVLEEANFRDLGTVLAQHAVGKADGIVLDLGYSSDQLEVSGRGFSFERDEPLTMTLSVHPSRDGVTAEEAVNTWSEESLADVLFGFGEERRARRIARAIVETRVSQPLRTSKELASLIASVVPRRGRIHPATKTFQALRIAVNDELGALEAFLSIALDVLAPGGRLAIISFHSLEDRLVKRAFRAWESRGAGTMLHRRPRVPADAELSKNPRARSARLRTFTTTHL